MEQKKYFADYHVHTAFSDDSECPMEKMLGRALELESDEIAFTEHVDYGVKTDLNCDYEKYFQKIARMKQKYAGRIVIRAGIEFGVQIDTAEQFQADFAKYPFDFVILSNHQINNQEFWNYAYQMGRTQEEYQSDYYRAIYEVMQRFHDYSVLGHLDMIKRYDKYGDFPDEKIMEYIDPILKQVILDGKGIEVNTSSFRYGLKDLMPSRNILRRYRELGGTILTIGSDTHETEHLADHIREVRKSLRDMGYQKFCTFEKMVLTEHDL